MLACTLPIGAEGNKNTRIGVNVELSMVLQLGQKTNLDCKYAPTLAALLVLGIMPRKPDRMTGG